MKKEDYEKGMMKFKKVELVEHLWKVREKTKLIREIYEKYKDEDFTLRYITKEIWRTIKEYLGEK